jgi:hypothetical protein
VLLPGGFLQTSAGSVSLEQVKIQINLKYVRKCAMLSVRNGGSIMEKILITGFEPFGARTENASWEAVSRLPEQIGAYQLVKKRLPTVFGQAADEAIGAA